MQKGLRESDDLVSGAREIMILNPFLRKETEAYSYALESVAEQITDNGNFNWEEAIKFNLPCKSGEDHPATRTITIADDKWTTIEVSYQKYAGTSKITFSRVLYICLAWTIHQLQLKRIENGYHMIANSHNNPSVASDYIISVTEKKTSSIEKFEALDIDSKLTEIYRLLLEVKSRRDS